VCSQSFHTCIFIVSIMMTLYWSKQSGYLEICLKNCYDVTKPPWPGLSSGGEGKALVCDVVVLGRTHTPPPPGLDYLVDDMRWKRPLFSPDCCSTVH
jgi:hypothetical protein